MDIKKIGTLHSRGTTFQYYCQGDSHSIKLLLRQGNANKPEKDLCVRKVRISRVHHQMSLLVVPDPETGMTVMWEFGALNNKGGIGPWNWIGPNVPWHWQIFKPFFKYHNLQPIYLDGMVDIQRGYSPMMGHVSL